MIRRAAAALLTTGLALLGPASVAALEWDTGSQVYPPGSTACGSYSLDGLATTSHGGEIRGLLWSQNGSCEVRYFVSGSSAAGFTVERAGVRMRNIQAVAADDTGTYFLWDQYTRAAGKALHLTKRLQSGEWTDRVVIKSPGFRRDTMAAHQGHWWIAAPVRRSDTLDSRFAVVVWEAGKGKTRLTPKSWDNYATQAYVSVSPTGRPMVASFEVSARGSGKRVTGPVVYTRGARGWSRPKFVMTPTPLSDPYRSPYAFTAEGEHPVMAVQDERQRWWVVSRTESGWTTARYRYDKSRYSVSAEAEQGRVWLVQGPWRGTEPMQLVDFTAGGWERSPLPPKVYVDELLSLGDGRVNVFSARTGDGASSELVWTGTP